jgi:putative DNA primase/helicase
VGVPASVVSAVAARGQWNDVRPLVALTRGPILRPNGTVADREGYDRETGALYIPGSEYPTVPERPTRDDATQAVGELLGVVADFPFSSAAHRSAWLSIVLSLVGRSSIEGCVPLALIDANTRGSGKTLLADIAGLIATGQTLPRMAPVREDEEQRKRITTIAMSGDAAVLVDNVTGTLGTPSLDAALTSMEWSDRLLGGNTPIRLPLRAVWIATGNNVSLVGDMSRRTLHVRLDSPDENPESREGFRHPHLLEFVREHRPRLLVAALIVLRAYFVAGLPDQRLKPWGSFGEWTRVVRSSLVWLGQPDPAETRIELTNAADRDRDVLERLLAGLEKAGLAREPKTAADLLHILAADDPAHQELRDAIAEGCGTPIDKLPDARKFGAMLRKFRGRVMGQRALDHGPKTGAGVRWMIRERRRDSGDSSDSGEHGRDDGRGRAAQDGLREQSPQSPQSHAGLDDERDTITEFGGGE